MTDQTTTEPAVTEPNVARNIYQRISAVQAEIGYIQKDRTVSTGAGTVGYKAVSHDVVIAMVRPHLIKHGIVVATSLAGDTKFDPAPEGSKQRLFSAEFVVSFINIDNPDDRLVVMLPAHALDNGDKAPGKAISYATKYAILKTFALETGDDEESRHQTGDYDFAAALDVAESGDRETAREAITEARKMALKLRDAAAAKAIAEVQKRLVTKFAGEAR
jgi:hypothetical protein